MNQILLIGRLTKDPELKYTKDGKGYCNFSLAVSREFKKDEVDFINCVAWDKRAEAIANYVKKGHRLAVMGRIQIDKNNDTFYTKIVVDKIEFLENAKSSQEPENTDDDSFPF